MKRIINFIIVLTTFFVVGHAQSGKINVLTDRGSTKYDISQIQEISFTCESMTISMKEGDSRSYDIKDIKEVCGNEVKVDLGLSVMWASHNVGATHPWNYGNYYAWGDNEWDGYYYEDSCPAFNVRPDMLKLKGIIDNYGNLSEEYDVAKKEWGGSWRMPTEAEMRELVSKCTWRWIEDNGVEGYRVTGPNGNSIFLPAAGVRSGSGREFAGSAGSYWSSTVYSDNYSAYKLFFYYGVGKVDDCPRYYGLSVRPVSE